MPLRLESFETVERPADADALLDASALEEARLAAFEAGYKAGWDDAVTARTEDDEAERAEIARSLQGLSFTYHEARFHVLRALSPLMAEVATRLLPSIAHAALPQLVAEALGPYAELAADAPVIVMVAPAARQRIEALLGNSAGLPLQVREDAGLSPGQVWLKLGETETRIDLDAALATIRAALDDFFDHAAAPAKETRHG